MTRIYIHIYICWFVRICRPSGFYAQPLALTHGSDSIEQTQGQVWLRRGAETHLNIAGNH